MKEHRLLRLRPGVTFTEQGDRVGLCLETRTCWARDGTQAALLRALSRGALDPDALCGEAARPPGDAQTALTLAALILDFGDYLEAVETGAQLWNTPLP